MAEQLTRYVYAVEATFAIQAIIPWWLLTGSKEWLAYGHSKYHSTCGSDSWCSTVWHIHAKLPWNIKSNSKSYSHLKTVICNYAPTYSSTFANYSYTLKKFFSNALKFQTSMLHIWTFHVIINVLLPFAIVS